MTKLSLLLVVLGSGCVDPEVATGTATAASTKEDVPGLSPAYAFIGDYLVHARGQLYESLEELTPRIEQVGLVGRMHVDGTGAQMIFSTELSRARVAPPYTIHDCSLAPEFRAGFGHIDCVATTTTNSERLIGSYVISPDGRKVLVDGRLAIYDRVTEGPYTSDVRRFVLKMTFELERM